MILYNIISLKGKDRKRIKTILCNINVSCLICGPLYYLSEGLAPPARDRLV